VEHAIERRSDRADEEQGDDPPDGVNRPHVLRTRNPAQGAQVDPRAP